MAPTDPSCPSIFGYCPAGTGFISRRRVGFSVGRLFLVSNCITRSSYSWLKLSLWRVSTGYAVYYAVTVLLSLCGTADAVFVLMFVVLIAAA